MEHGYLTTDGPVPMKCATASGTPSIGTVRVKVIPDIVNDPATLIGLAREELDKHYPGRARSLAITKLDEALMWLERVPK